ncbi:hypothetical protein C8J57DRAFT_1238070 [Mycena rebaudengoi]|nr:hypothetical protein C8J57DRAFT_1238070 [Mycena rebaudengoi]
MAFLACANRTMIIGGKARSTGGQNLGDLGPKPRSRKDKNGFLRVKMPGPGRTKIVGALRAENSTPKRGPGRTKVRPLLPKFVRTKNRRVRGFGDLAFPPIIMGPCPYGAGGMDASDRTRMHDGKRIGAEIRSNEFRVLQSMKNSRPKTRTKDKKWCKIRDGIAVRMPEQRRFKSAAHCDFKIEARDFNAPLPPKHREIDPVDCVVQIPGGTGCLRKPSIKSDSPNFLDPSPGLPLGSREVASLGGGRSSSPKRKRSEDGREAEVEKLPHRTPARTSIRPQRKPATKSKRQAGPPSTVAVRRRNKGYIALNSEGEDAGY